MLHALSPLIPSHNTLRMRARNDLAVGQIILGVHKQHHALIGAADRLADSVLAALSAVQQQQSPSNNAMANGVQLVITEQRAQSLGYECPEGAFIALSKTQMPMTRNNVLRCIDPTYDSTHTVPLSCSEPVVITYEHAWHAFISNAIACVKMAQALPAIVIVPIAQTPEDWAARHTITCFDFTDPPPVPSPAPPPMQFINKVRLPLHDMRTDPSPNLPPLVQNNALYLFRDCAHVYHYAIVIGDTKAYANNQTAPLTRVHSGCMTGDILGSLKCDCRAQLQNAIGAMQTEQAGILIYLNQEGRGIGLVNKLKAYNLQEQGQDTVSANHALGFAADERDFTLAAQILNHLNVLAVRLLTNNPHKVKTLAAAGITIQDWVSLRTSRTMYNASYLDTKARKLGHRL